MGKKRHCERKQWKSCVINSCDFTSCVNKFKQDQKYSLLTSFLFFCLPGADVPEKVNKICLCS